MDVLVVVVVSTICSNSVMLLFYYDVIMDESLDINRFNVLSVLYQRDIIRHKFVDLRSPFHFLFQK